MKASNRAGFLPVTPHSHLLSFSRLVGLPELSPENHTLILSQTPPSLTYFNNLVQIMMLWLLRLGMPGGTRGVAKRVEGLPNRVLNSVDEFSGACLFQLWCQECKHYRQPVLMVCKQQ